VGTKTVRISLPLTKRARRSVSASKQTASGQTKNTVVDSGVDSLQQFSTSMELLSKRVSWHSFSWPKTPKQRNSLVPSEPRRSRDYDH